MNVESQSAGSAAPVNSDVGQGAVSEQRKLSRRKILATALATAPLLITLHARPVFGGHSTPPSTPPTGGTLGVYGYGANTRPIDQNGNPIADPTRLA